MHIDYNDGYYDGDVNCDEERHGYGKCVWDDGTYYVGDWRNDEMNCQGELVFASGDYYKGSFQDGEFNGYGYFRYSNGNTYEGYWSHDDWHGSGKLIQSNGVEVEGNWMDHDNASNVIMWANGKTYRGRTVNGRFEESEDSKKTRLANLGSTARTLPQNVVERLALEEVKNNPFASDARVINLTMNDSRWNSADGWVKMERVINIRKFIPSDGGSGEISLNIVVHYVANRRKNLVDDFKIKSISYK